MAAPASPSKAALMVVVEMAVMWWRKSTASTSA
jgi:hypothetical protein